MLIVTLESIPGTFSFKVLGVVSGNSIKNVSQSVPNKNSEGYFEGYEAAMAQFRQRATQKMTAQATEMGADAILGVKYTTTSITSNFLTELMVSGTAVKLVLLPSSVPPNVRPPSPVQRSVPPEHIA
eukprot:Trichotokara_eunicae@DN5258_c0_g1_i1.p1